MYMILVGYDQSKISILTTYNGQKLLIRDIIQRKCAWHSLFKKPAKVCFI
jgi:intron-binding protein aquarius